MIETNKDIQTIGEMVHLLVIGTLPDSVLVGYREWWIGWGYDSISRRVVVCGFYGNDFFDSDYRDDRLTIHTASRINSRAGNRKLLLAADALCLIFEELGIYYKLSMKKNDRKTWVRYSVVASRTVTISDLDRISNMKL